MGQVSFQYGNSNNFIDHITILNASSLLFPVLRITITACVFYFTMNFQYNAVYSYCFKVATIELPNLIEFSIQCC